MINNSALVAAGVGVVWGALFGCSQVSPAAEEPLQGVVEFDEINLGFELGGRVREVAVKQGDVVAAGAPLAELDDELERSARDASERQAEAAQSQVSVVQAGSRPEEIASMAARLRAAQAAEELVAKDLARQRTLLERGAVAQASVDTLESRHAEARAQREAAAQNLALLRRGARAVDVQAAEAKAGVARSSVRLDDVRLAHHSLKAPRAGTVLDVHVEPGEVVAFGTPVLTLGDTAHPYADVFVPQGNLAGIRVGSVARGRIDALSGAFTGSVEHIERRTEFTPRYLFSERERPNLVVRVRVRFDDPSGRLYAGVPAFVSIERAR